MNGSFNEATRNYHQYDTPKKNRTSTKHFTEITMKYGINRQTYNIHDDPNFELSNIANEFLNEIGMKVEKNIPIILMKHDYYTQNILTPVKKVEDVEHGTIIEVIIGETIETYTNGVAHDFFIENYKKPTFCDECNLMLEGLVRQGVKCRMCYQNYHKHCAIKIANQLCLCTVTNYNKPENRKEDDPMGRNYSLKSRRMSLVKTKNRETSSQSTINKKNPKIKISTNESTSSGTNTNIYDSADKISRMNSGKILGKLRRSLTKKREKEYTPNTRNEQIRVTLENRHEILLAKTKNESACHGCFDKIPVLKEIYTCKKCLMVCHKDCLPIIAKYCVNKESFQDISKIDSSLKINYTKKDAAIPIVIDEEKSIITKNNKDLGRAPSIISNKSYASQMIPLQRLHVTKVPILNSFNKIIFRGYFVHSTTFNQKKTLEYWVLDSERIIMLKNRESSDIVKNINLIDITGIYSATNYISSKFNKEVKSDFIFAIETPNITYFCGERERITSMLNIGPVDRNKGIGVQLGHEWMEAINNVIGKYLNAGDISLINEEKILNSKDVKESDIDKFYLINRKNYIGSGQFGVVYSGLRRSNKQDIALKVVNLERFSKVHLSTFKSEFYILQSLDHDGIIKALRMIQTPEKLYLVLERMYGDLLELILKSKEGHLSELHSKFSIYQVLCTVKYLHGLDIAHCDLKPENILLSRYRTNSGFYQLKLCDFGFARYINKLDFRMSTVGTPAYLAPEVIYEKKYNRTLDIWSLGVITYAALSGTFPFNDDGDIREQIKNASFMYPDDLWSNISVKAISFINYLLDVDYNTRPTAVSAIKNKWFMDPALLDEIYSLEQQINSVYMSSIYKNIKN